MGPLTALKTQVYRHFTTDYPYQALNANDQEIRVLDILPGSLVCKLRTVPLKSAQRPAYATISYCWGDPTPCERLQVDNHAILVPASAKLALKRVTVAKDHRTVWIDAICINQKDKAERASQVSLMGRVFTLSAQNLVYLGEPEETTATAFEDIKKITVQIEKDIEAANVQTLKDLLYRNGQAQDASVPISIDVSGYCLDQLFRYPWFRRVWIIQEAILPPRGICYCGKLQIDLSDILNAAAWLNIWHRLHPIKHLGLGFDNNGLEAAASIWRTGKGARSLTNMLSRSEEVHASDRHDRVYGLLGLLYPDAEVPALLQPDYDKPVAHVYRDAMIHCLKLDRDTRIFSRIYHRDNSTVESTDWPSWVLHFDRLATQHLEHNPLPNIYNHRDGRDHMNHATVPRQSSSFDLNELVLSGFPLDSIDRIEETILTNRYWQPTTNFDDVRRFFRESAPRYKDPKQRAQLARTLIAGISFLRSRVTEDYEQAFEILPDFMTTLRYRELKSRPECDATSAEPVMRASRYYNTMMQTCRGRKVAITSAGHIGLIPDVCQRGDVIAIMHNCIKPLALRPVGSEYCLLGECYIDGFMWEEERKRLDERDDLREVTFHIR